jgi:hypothetical protein
MTNIPPRDPASPRGPSPTSTKVDRRSQIAIGIVAVVLVVGAILYFSAASQRPDQDASDTPAATTEPAPATNAPAENTTTQ